MTIDFRFNEPNSPTLQLRRSAWTNHMALFADGHAVPMQPKKGLFDQFRTFLVPMPDGSQRELVFKLRPYDPVPEAFVNGQLLTLAKSLKSWEYMVACLPLLLVFGAGLVGGALGFGASFINLNIMRSERPQGVRVALALGVTLVAFVVVFLLIGLVQLAIDGRGGAGR